MRCKYCGCSDESELAMRSTRVGDEVMHEWICLSCLWIFFLTLKVEVEGKNGERILSEAREAAEGRILGKSARDI